MVKRLAKKERFKRKLYGILLFLLFFNLLSIPLYVAIYTDFSFQALQELNALFLYLTLKFFGHNVTLDGYFVNLVSDAGIKQIEVSWDSTGWKSMYALSSLIIATPISKFSRRLKFAVGGTLTIFALNYLRISTTVLASISLGFNLFDIIHTVLWREGMILGVVLLWFLWLRREKYIIGRNQIKSKVYT